MLAVWLYICGGIRQVSRARQRLPVPRYHVDNLVIHPAHRGSATGVYDALVAAGLDRTAGQPITAETVRADLRDRYQSIGFQVLATVDLPCGGQRWVPLRHPQPPDHGRSDQPS